MMALALPPDAYRATIVPHNNKFRLKGWAADVPVTTPTDAVRDRIKMEWMVPSTWHAENLQHVAAHLSSSRPLCAVSDGSFHPALQVGTAAWVLHTGDHTHDLGGSNVVPGPKEVQCAHRSELSGLIGAVRHVNLICHMFQITSGDAELGCDGLEAYNVATRHTFDPSTKVAHFDLVSALHYLIRSSPLCWTFRHVAGHQDDHCSLEDIDVWGRLNITADRRAKEYLWHTVSEGTYLETHSAPAGVLGPVHCDYNDADMFLVSHLSSSLKSLVARRRATEFWECSQETSTPSPC